MEAVEMDHSLVGGWQKKEKKRWYGSGSDSLCVCGKQHPDDNNRGISSPAIHPWTDREEGAEHLLGIHIAACLY